MKHVIHSSWGYQPAEQSEPTQEEWVEYYHSRDTKLRDQLFYKTYRLITYTIAKYNIVAYDIMGYEDLLTSGAIGLLDAISKYDPYRGTKFTTIAVQRIYGEIIDDYRRVDPVPRGMRKKINDCKRMIAYYRDKQPEVEEHEVVKDFGLTEREHLILQGNFTIPIDKVIAAEQI